MKNVLTRAQRTIVCLGFAALILSATVARGEDWPMWRHDNDRTSGTDEKLTPPLELAWTFKSLQSAQAPFIGNPMGIRYPYVTWYTLPICAAGDSLFFNSAIDGRIVCLDAATGKTRWQFAAGAAVNRTPTYWNGKLYAGSDDGHVYCIDAKYGKVIWAFDAAPNNRTFMSYGKLVSLWPVRTDISVTSSPGINGGKAVAYFGAGVFPYEGTFLYAIDAETGTKIWRNDTQCETGWRASMSPAGYLWINDKANTILPGRDTWGYGGAQWGMLTTFNRDTGAAGAWVRDVPPFLGARKGDKGFGAYPVKGRWTDDSVFGARYKQPVFFRWDPDSCQIVYSGGIVYSTAVDMGTSKMTGIYAHNPGENDKPPLWSVDVDGQIDQIIVANGRLFATTREGVIYCFAKKGGNAVVQETPDKAPLAANPAMTTAADTILKQSGITSGFAVVLDSDSGSLALQLAQKSNLTAIAVFKDEKKAATARLAYAKTGLTCSRLLALVQKPGERLPFPRYFADLITSEAAVSGGALPSDLDELNRILKPYRGVVCIGGEQPKDILQAWTSKTGQKNWTVTQGWAKLVAPPLADAGGWQMELGDAGNSSSSNDGALKGPLGVLWYGDPVLGYPGPNALIIDGVFLFCPGGDLIARDAYTGREMWKHPHGNTDTACAPGSVFLRYLEIVVRLDPQTGKELAVWKPPFENSQWLSMAPSHDGKELYLVAGNKEFKATVCMDVANGKVLWTRGGPGSKEPYAGGWTVIGDGYIFILGGGAQGAHRDEGLADMRAYLKKTNPKGLEQFEKEAAQRDIRIVATLDSHTGKILHERGVDITNCGGAWVPGAGFGGGKNARYLNPPVSAHIMAAKDCIIFCTQSGADKGWPMWPTGAYKIRGIAVYSGKENKLLWNKGCNYRTMPAVSDETIYAEPWAYDLHTGERVQRMNPISGEKSDWAFCRWDKQCGRFSASKNIIFGRSLGTGLIDVQNDTGMYTFWHSRPNCYYDTYSGSGTMIKPPNAIGCECTWSLPFTIAMGQVETQPPAPSGFAQPGTCLPVKHLYMDFGGTGDRRDTKGNLWINAPHGAGHPLILGFASKNEYYKNSGAVQRSSMFTPIENTDTPFVFATAFRGLKSCVISLTKDGDGEHTYTVRLGFNALPGDKPGQRVFDVKLDGKTVLENFDIVKEAGKPDVAVWKEFKVKAGKELTLELVVPDAEPALDKMPLISGLVILRQE